MLDVALEVERPLELREARLPDIEQREVGNAVVEHRGPVDHEHAVAQRQLILVPPPVVRRGGRARGRSDGAARRRAAERHRGDAADLALAVEGHVHVDHVAPRDDVAFREEGHRHAVDDGRCPSGGDIQRVHALLRRGVQPIRLGRDRQARDNLRQRRATSTVS
ncbi:MAG: hypothetical protein U0470_11335 [Anaerolineae bacterium]